MIQLRSFIPHELDTPFAGGSLLLFRTICNNLAGLDTMVIVPVAVLNLLNYPYSGMDQVIPVMLIQTEAKVQVEYTQNGQVHELTILR